MPPKRKQAGTPAWIRLGELLKARRAELDSVYWQRSAFVKERAEPAGLAYKLIQDLENNDREDFPPPTLEKVADLYEVTRESLRAVLEGDGDLAALPGSPPHRTRSRPASAPPSPEAPLPAFTRRGGFELPPDIRRRMAPHSDLIEARLLAAAIAEARQRGVPLEAVLGPDLDDPAWVPPGAAVFPHPDETQERAWWDALRAEGILGTPHTGPELADSVALLMVRREVRSQGSDGNPAEDLTASLMRG